MFNLLYNIVKKGGAIMLLGDKIKQLRTQNKMTMQELADKTNLTKGYISMLEKGKNPQSKKEITPSIATVKKIAMAFNMDIDTLLIGTDSNVELPQPTSTLTLINDNAKLLTEDRQRNVLDYTKLQLEEQHSTINEISTLYAVEAVEQLAAGVGFAYGDNETNKYYTDRSDLKPYDVASVVNGDSMEPSYLNGDIVLIRNGYDSVNGAVYAIDYDGKSYLKKVYFEGNRIRLVSINRKYDDIHIYLPIEDNTYLNIIGKVVDHFTPVSAS